MIKVSFYSAMFNDVCNILENDITNQIDVEYWLMEKIPSINFSGMDYPHDLECYYDCYFESSTEEADAQSVYCLLKEINIWTNE